jgi:plasmid stability protein
MTVTVKLEPSLEERLRRRAAGSGMSTSDVIRAALTAYLTEADEPRGASPFALGSDLFGRHEGPADLATNRKRHALDAWAKKREARHGG